MTLVDEVVAAHGGLERWRRMSSTAIIATTGQHMAPEGAGWAHEFDTGIPQLRGLRWSTGRHRRLRRRGSKRGR